MKNCTDCKHARWQRTASGRLHPSGYGNCTVPYKIPPLPTCMYWLTTPTPMGGLINRKRELRDHCPYYVASAT